MIYQLCMLLALAHPKSILHLLLRYSNFPLLSPFLFPSGFYVNKCDFYVILSVYCIKCWDCRSDSDPKCGDPFDNSTVPITDCSQARPLEHIPDVKATMCRKIRQKGKSIYCLKVSYLNKVFFVSYYLLILVLIIY